ncbi:MAG: hypothetical protein EPN86_01795 [Nanoarchaeota archaeon]|nr:MAG: hypothetical protein EPN86_01795 [Nanoarchaeota archaeon]
MGRDDGINDKVSVPSGSRIFSSDPHIYYFDPSNEGVAVNALREFWGKYAMQSVCDFRGMGKLRNFFYGIA